MGINILVADDEVNANEKQKEVLREQIKFYDSHIDFVGTTEEALQKISDSFYPLVLADIRMPKNVTTDTSWEAGEEMITTLATTYPDLKLIIISAYYGIKSKKVEDQLRSHKNVLDFLPKPLDVKKLTSSIEQNFLDIQPLNFFYDYSGLKPETAEFLKTRAIKIKQAEKDIAYGICQIGQYLTETKSFLDHGEYLNWLSKEFAYSKTTAWRFMRVYESFKLYDLRDENIPASALYLLASPSVSDETREEAIALSRNKKSILISEVQELINSEKEDNSSSFNSEELKTESISPAKSAQSLDAPRNESTILPSTSGLTNVNPRKPAEIYKVRIKPRWWKLGDRHLLHCGDPLSPEFKKRLPLKVSLSLAYPSTPNYPLGDLVEAHSYWSLSTLYNDPDPNLLREMIDRLFRLYTEADESVVISFLPDPSSLLIAHNLGCLCYVADPVRERCEAAIEAWEGAGGKTEESL